MKRISLFILRKMWLCRMIACIIFLFCFIQHGNTQRKKKAKEEKNEKTTSVVSGRDSLINMKKLIAMGKYFGSSVILRWAPKNAAAWDKTNESGYQLYRFEVDSKSSDPLTHSTQLTTSPLKPFPLDQWKKQFPPEDTAAAIAAEVLYGKKFETSGKQNGKFNWGEAYTKYADMENRLGIALLNSDLHPEIATGMAWSWEDKTIEKDKLYYYLIISPALGQLAADTVSVLVSTKQSYKLPDMLPVFAMPWDKTITLYWNKVAAVHQFTCYYLERSDDNGKSFRRLNTLPYIDGGGNDKERRDWMHYTDSIPQNYKLYVYRVRGVTAFGEISNPSSPVKIAGADKTSPGSPFNVKAENTKGSEVKISWQKSAKEKDLAGFLVGRGSSVNGPFFPLDTVLLPATAQSYVDRFAVTWDKNFYIVAAIDTAGNASRSMPAYAMIVDSIAPAMPVGLAGSIDTAGVVRLHWRWNKEMDLQGYNVYASNNPTHAFYILNSKFLTDTLFTDTISIKTLTRHIYYRICAFDKAGNPSAYSKIIELTKPDIVPPVAPVINHFLITDSSVVLQWARSSSEDVARQVIWRKEKNDSVWKSLDSLKKDTSIYVDRNIVRLKEYDYSLTAVDSSGLSSERSFPLRARIYDSGKRPAVDELKVDITDNREIHLTWKYNSVDKTHMRFIVYRNYNNNGLEMYRSVAADKNEFIDNTLPGEGNYQYAIKAVTSDGGASVLVNSQIVKYERKGVAIGK
ncbi:MAG: hypothetical protein JST75_10260 [Bacteroidetes bacterium]|nr:hypothetical protein [Bacteroidota bacterium]